MRGPRAEGRMSATAAALRPGRSRGLGAAVKLAGRARAPDAAGLRLWLCAVPVLGLLLLWGARDGGYDAPSWLGGAVALVALGAWARLVFGPGHALGRRGRVALAGLGLYVRSGFASVPWAGDQGNRP